MVTEGERERRKEYSRDGVTGNYGVLVGRFNWSLGGGGVEYDNNGDSEWG